MLIWYKYCIYTFVQTLVYAVLGLFVPYFDLDVMRLPTPPCVTLADVHFMDIVNAYQIQRPSHEMILYTRAILRPPSSHHDDRMLLHIVT
jgi:hypothetical protein